MPDEKILPDPEERPDPESERDRSKRLADTLDAPDGPAEPIAPRSTEPLLSSDSGEGDATITADSDSEWNLTPIVPGSPEITLLKTPGPSPHPIAAPTDETIAPHAPSTPSALHALRARQAPSTSTDPSSPLETSLVSREVPTLSEQKTGVSDSQIRLPDLEIERELGKGGMGTVYLAHETTLDRKVAVKVISMGVLASEMVRERFRRESRLAASLSHPHIIQIHQSGELSGFLYFTMEYIDRANLRQCVDQGELTRRNGVDAVRKIARAVDFLHSNGIIHRDLKPDNILVRANGEPVLMDFGLARSMEEDQSLTVSQSVMGSPPYMSPEQADGDTEAIDPLSDVYSLGCILFYTLTGQPPFLGPTVQKTLHQVRFREPSPPSQIDPEIDRDLDNICLKCLSKEPNLRYSSAGALADDLDRHHRGEPVLARPPSTIRRIARFVRRHPIPIGTALAAIAVIVVVTIVAFVRIDLSRGEARDAAEVAVAEKGRAEFQTEQARQARSVALDEMKKAQQRLAEVYGERTRRAYRERRDPEGWILAAQWLVLDDDPSGRFELGLLRDRAWRCAEPITIDGTVKIFDPVGGHLLLDRDGTFSVIDLDGHDRGVWTNSEGSIPLALSPQGNRISYSDPQTHLYVATLGSFASPIRIEISSELGRLSHVVFSPSGETMAVVQETRDRSRLTLWQSSGSAVGSTPIDLSPLLPTVRFNDQGDSIVLYGRDGSIEVRRTRDLEPIAIVAAPSEQVRCLALAPTGNQVAAGTSGGTIHVWNLPSGDLTTQYSREGDAVEALVFDPTGRILASTASSSPRIVLNDPTTGGKRGSFPLPGPGRWEIGFSRDGNRFLARSQESEPTIHRWSVGPQEQGRFRLPEDLECADLGQDGRTVVLLDLFGAIQIGELQRECFRPRASIEGIEVERLALSSDGRWLVAADLAQEVHLLDATSGKVLFRFPGRLGQVTNLAHGPADSFLYSLSADGTLRVWESQSERLASTWLVDRSAAVTGRMEISSDGSIVALGEGSDSFEAFRVGERKPLTSTPTGSRIDALALDSAGVRVATGNRAGAIEIWDLAGQAAPIRLLENRRGAPPDPITALEFRPGGQELWSGHASGEIALWTIEERLVRVRRRLFDGPVERLRLDPEGRVLFASGSDGSVFRLDLSVLDESVESLVAEARRETGLELDAPDLAASSR